MASFRTLLPAPGRQRKHDGDDDDGSSSSQAPTSRRLPKRIRSVPQACQMCRQMKAKCDGGRPRCRNCIDRDRPCGYEGEAGQSRQAAMRSRLMAYESLFASLRTGSPADTDRLLQRMRQLEDPVAMVREEGGSLNAAPAALASASAPASATSATSPVVSPGESSSGSGNEMSASPRHSTDHAAVNPAPVVVELVLPGLATTKRAITEFYGNCSKLFHVFSEEEASRFCDVVFGALEMASDESRKITASCLAAIVAKGIQLSPDSFEPSTAQAAYDMAKHNFELAAETSPFIAIKMTALLAMFNVMKQNRVALMWIGIGLKLCRTNGLTQKNPIDPIISMAEWTKLRKVWRTLVFLSCWLSFTLGSTFGQEVEFERANPVAMELETSPHIDEIVQAESAKISIITVEILHVHLAFKEISVLSFESVLRDLQGWHDRLPPQLHLTALLDGATVSVVSQMSFFHLHLMHMGAIMLVYRRMASQFNYAVNSQPTHQILAQGLDDIPLTLFTRGIEAARASARIMSLLLEDANLFRRSWILILQAYTSCLVILHVLSQKQLHKCLHETWQADIQHARVCLHVLSYNSSVDDIARDYHEKLFPMFLELSEVRPRPFEVVDDRSESVSILLAIPPDAPVERARISVELMSMIGQPFRNLLRKSDDVRPPSNSSFGQFSRLDWPMDSR